MEYALAEDTYRGLFDGMLDGIEVIDATTGRIVLANKVAAMLFGFDSPEDMVGIDPLDYVLVKEDKARAVTMFAETFEKDPRRVLELRAQRRDGAEIWVSAMGAKFHFGGRLASLVSFRDITEQKLMEEKLREAEDRQIQLWDNSSELMAVTRDWKIILVNRRFEEVLLTPRQALIGLSILDIAHPDDRQALAERYQGILNGVCPSPLGILRGIDGHGRTWWGEFREVPIMWKGEPAIMSLIQDVTERRRAEEALQESERRYRLVTDNVKDMIWTMDKDLRFTYISPSAKWLLGYTPEELAAMDPLKVTVPSSHGVAMEAISAGTEAAVDMEKWNQIHESQWLSYDIEALRKDG